MRGESVFCPSFQRVRGERGGTRFSCVVCEWGAQHTTRNQGLCSTVLQAQQCRDKAQCRSCQEMSAETRLCGDLILSTLCGLRIRSPQSSADLMCPWLHPRGAPTHIPAHTQRSLHMRSLLSRQCLVSRKSYAHEGMGSLVHNHDLVKAPQNLTIEAPGGNEPLQHNSSGNWGIPI